MQEFDEDRRAPNPTFGMSGVVEQDYKNPMQIRLSLKDLAEISVINAEMLQLRRCLEEVSSPGVKKATISLIVYYENSPSSKALGVPVSGHNIVALLHQQINIRKAALAKYGIDVGDLT
ncbi:hypothetical protein [Methylovulum miyakonense]|uniref:hypothetical protein n=1 Tax=Methylovulum miyakonense TaxID=645578 RepID=UPI0003753F73|nr:hypothetical protein [Methylovulum miyakonense]